MSSNEDNLENALKRLIKTNGPISMAQYMGECLAHPEYGYYNTRDPFGSQGDFTTAPEVSQMFGEMLGMWLANQWQALQSNEQPSPIELIELGPGRGTLMADILRVLNIVPELKNNLTVHMVEMSPTLRTAQQQALASEKGVSINWHKTLADVPEGYGFIIANEFFDALPVHQFEITDNGWRERMVGVASDTDDALAPCLSEPSPALFMLDTNMRDNAKLGDMLEVSPLSISIMGEVSRRIKQHGGSGLFIDYGYKKTAYGDSIQAVKNHAPCPILEIPGEVDLTAHVNFEILAQCASQIGLATYGAIEQGEFLKQMGIEMRAEKLSANASTEQKQDIAAAIKRLTNDDEMGTLFKVLAVTSDDLPKPVGFEIVKT